MFNVPVSNQITLDQDRKRLAVQMRLDGMTIQSVQSATRLSRPTIIALHKVYLEKGWEGINQRRSGRPTKPKATVNYFIEQNKLITQQDQAVGPGLWDKISLAKELSIIRSMRLDERKALSILTKWQWNPPYFKALVEQIDFAGTNIQESDLGLLAKTKRLPFLVIDHYEIKVQSLNEFAPVTEGSKYSLLFARGTKDQLLFKLYPFPLSDANYLDFYQRLSHHYPKGFVNFLQIAGLHYTPQFQKWLSAQKRIFTQAPNHNQNSQGKDSNISLETVRQNQLTDNNKNKQGKKVMNKSSVKNTLTHLERLEAESIHIMREVVAEAEKPVMLYSIGKDSAVMLHIALKAFYPAKLPFPLLHVDTLWKFKDMYRFRDQMAKEHNFELLIHTNQEGIALGINPFSHGSQIHTDVMKTQALKQALDQYGFDVAFGGARRDEEKSRAKERIFSFRNAQHHWNPKQQRPELWNLYNAKKNPGESIRVFPLSNWTELDVWQYIYLENIPLVPLYFSQKRPVVWRDNAWIMVDDDRMPLAKGEVPQMKNVRFRTLGCYPLTGAIESNASTLPEIIQEMLLTKTSERQGRVIDRDSSASMEKKKQEGYF